ncbi:uncharacterized protein PV09_09233 [Verruconis gallopava]|uniref:Metallo-beta-lactamase domain-containing protein n=1 Tax=Verruconis gallopava TaxID=253628 RepID=A0A0D1ZXA1_9PEZI|nr:uncharacterized protein PV09_09233 [Verruconis gallopava]KIV99067.1 hypothetical protein PV09_09233 [Verruconis gallopava]
MMASARRVHILPGGSLTQMTASRARPSTARLSTCASTSSPKHLEVTRTYSRQRDAKLASASSGSFRQIPVRCSDRSPQISRFSTKGQQTSNPTIHDVFESKTGSWQYIVADPDTSVAVIIDPVLDYDPISHKVDTKSADELLAIVKDKGYKVDRILETHAHADHITAASYVQRKLQERQGHRPPICIGSRIGHVQDRFSTRYSVPPEEYRTVFDKLLDDNEEFSIGNLKATAVHIPGHTPDHMGYKIGDNVFTGDLIFYKDLGTARADFPGGSASQIYQSAQKILSMPDHVRVWVGHDYPPDGREPKSSMTVKEHRQENKHLKEGMTEAEFVKLRQERDAQLAAPKLLHQSLQMNIRGGKLPQPNQDGQRMLHVPLKLGQLSW